MKRSTKLALTLVLAAGMIVPAIAQDNFPDVPANHWAYEALARMKRDGLLVGYPDGLYRGTRPASRYELAVAMHAVYTNLKTQMDGLDAQLKALQGSINPQDIQNLKDQVAALQNEVNAMKGWGDDIAALKRATEQFDKELRSLGVDVEAMKKDLGDLADRVTRLEKRKPAVDISGDINFWAGTGNSSNGLPAMTETGSIVGHSGSAAVGLIHDLAVLHEGAFTATGTNETGPKWKVTAVVGNMLGADGFGNQSSLFGVTGGYGYAQANDDVYIQDAEVKWDTSIVGLGFGITAGRVGYKLNPYVFQRIDNMPYFSNERWDDGLYHFDGAILGFNFGSVKLNIWGGDNSNLDSVDGIDLNPTIIANNRFFNGPSEGILGTLGGIGAGNVGQIDKTAAADATIPLGKNGHVNLEYLWMEQEGTISPGTPAQSDGLLSGVNDLASPSGANRDNVYGGDLQFGFGAIKVEGGYHQSDLTDNDHTVNNSNNFEWDAKVKWEQSKFGLWAGYRQVDNDYFAPGDWGRLGILYNPANIKGAQAAGYYHITHAATISAGGEWDKGVDTFGGGASIFGLGTGSLFDSNTTIDSYNVRLDYNINSNLSLYGAYEDTQFKESGGTFNVPEFGWATIGFGYGLSSNAKLNVQYQFSNVLNGPADPADASPFGRYEGGFLTTQLSIKF